MNDIWAWIKSIFNKNRQSTYVSRLKIPRSWDREFLKAYYLSHAERGNFDHHTGLNQSSLDEHIVNLLIKNSGIVEVDNRSKLYIDLENYFGISKEDFNSIPNAEDKLDENAYFAFEDMLTKKKFDFEVLYRQHYSNVDDYLSQSLNDNAVTKTILDDRSVPEDLTIFARFKGNPLIIFINLREVFGVTYWQVGVHGEHSDEFLLLWKKLTEAYFIETHKGKVLDAQMKTISLTRYKMENLVFPKALDHQLSLLYRSFQAWYSTDNIKRWGAMLTGLPGMGKTTFANVLVTDKPTNCTVIYVHAKDFKEDSVSEVNEKICKLFDDALILSPTLLIFDDVDELALSRKGDLLETTTAAMLEYLDESQDSGKLFVMLTTNRPNVIDPAIKRAGRIHNIIKLDGYDKCVRELLILYADKFGLKLPDDLEQIISDWDIPIRITPDEISNIATRLVLKSRDSNTVSERELNQAFTDTMISFYSDTGKEDNLYE